MISCEIVIFLKNALQNDTFSNVKTKIWYKFIHSVSVCFDIKCLIYFSVSGATENDSQTKNILGLSKKKNYLISVKWFPFFLKKNHKLFSSLNLFFSNRRSSSDHRRTLSDHCRKLLDHRWSSLDHRQSSSDLRRSLLEVVGYFSPTLIFRTSQKSKIILKDFVENIVRWKTFSVETNITTIKYHTHGNQPFPSIPPNFSKKLTFGRTRIPTAYRPLPNKGIYDPKGKMQSRAYT